MLGRQTLDLVHVDQVVLAAHVVGDDLVELARDVELHPVAEMAAVVERHAHDRVAGLEQRHVGGVVGLGAGMGLDVRVLGPEQRLGAVDRELLGDVDLLAAAVVTAAGIALGVLVGQHRAGRVEHRLGNEVLRGDHLQRVLLASELAVEHLGDLGVDVGERGALEILRKIVHLGSDDSADSRPDNGSSSRRLISSAAIAPWRRMRSSPPSRSR